MTFSESLLDQVRSQTPGCRHVSHLHNSGSALMPDVVVNAVKEHLDLEALNGGYEAHALAIDKVKAVYDSVARLLNTNARNISLLESATAAWTRVFTALATTFKPGDRIITGRAEYASNYIAFLQAKAIYGIEIVVVDDDESGQFDVAHFDTLLDERARLIAVTHIPTNGGLVNPAAAIGQRARAAGVPFLLDACQSVGQVPLDVDEIQCDFLSGTGRKYLRGPRGSGFLYVSDGYLESVEPWPLDLYSANWDSLDGYTVCPDGRRFEYFESSLANRIGLGAAVDYYLEIGPDVAWTRIQALAGSLRERLKQMPGVELLDKGAEQCGIVSFKCEGLDPVRVQPLLRGKGINVGISNVTSTRLDMQERNITDCFRPSVHYYNTDDEVQQLLTELEVLNPKIVSPPG